VVSVAVLTVRSFSRAASLNGLLNAAPAAIRRNARLTLCGAL
jgi:hypothetical protein